MPAWTLQHQQMRALTERGLDHAEAFWVALRLRSMALGRITCVGLERWGFWEIALERPDRETLARKHCYQSLPHYWALLAFFSGSNTIHRVRP